MTSDLAETSKIVYIIEDSTANRWKLEGRSACMRTDHYCFDVPHEDDLGRGGSVRSAKRVFGTGYLLPGTASG